MNKYLVFILMALLTFNSCSKAQKIPFFPLQDTVIHYKGIIIRNPIDDNWTTDTIKWNFNTSFKPVYISKNLKIIQYVNLPLLSNFVDVFDYQTGKVSKENFDDSYIIIVSDSIYYSIYNNNDSTKDIMGSLKKLLANKGVQTEKEFIKLFTYPFLDLRRNKIVYHDPDPEYDYSFTTTKISKTVYKISEEQHNYDAYYLFDYKKGLYKIYYHWGRIVDYEIILEQVE